MHIGYLIQQYAPEVGAGPARAGEMAERWIRAGHRVTVHTAMPNRPEGRIHAAYRGKWSQSDSLGGVGIRRTWLYARPGGGFGTTLLNNLSFALTAGVDTLRFRPRWDVLIASAPPFFTHLTGVAIAALRRVPLVLEVRDLWPDYLVEMGVLRGASARALFALERSLLRRAARVVTVTEGLRRRVIEKGIAAERVVVITNGVDTARYYPATEPPPIPEVVRRNGEFLVGYLGNFGRGQDLGVVLEAAARLAASGARHRFVLAGDGPEGERIRAEAARQRLPNLVVRGPIAKEATRAFYNACDACLVPLAPLPAFDGAIPSKLFEILACARPVLASVRGEAAELLQGADAGIVRPPGDAAALAQGLEQLAALPTEMRTGMGERGRDLVGRRFGRDTLAARYLSLLQEVGRPA